MKPNLVVVLAGLVAGVAMAQEPLPAVAPFPLEFGRTPSGFTKKEREDVQKIVPLLLRGVDASVPDPSRLAAALAELKRQDCGREDECLAQLAKLAGSLYGLYAQVDYDTDGYVIAAGRVVRDDGVAMGKPATVRVLKGATGFKEVARDALNQLFAALGVKSLSPFRPSVEAPVVVVTPKVEERPVKLPEPNPVPPPVLPLTVTQPAEANEKAPGYALLGAGGAVAIAGGLVFGLANPRVDSNGVIDRGSSTPTVAVNAYNSARTQQGAGLVMAGIGAAAAATGIVLLLIPQKKTVAVAAVPTSGGVMISLGGVFP